MFERLQAIPLIAKFDPFLAGHLAITLDLHLRGGFGTHGENLLDGIQACNKGFANPSVSSFGSISRKTALARLESRVQGCGMINPTKNTILSELGESQNVKGNFFLAKNRDALVGSLNRVKQVMLLATVFVCVGCANIDRNTYPNTWMAFIPDNRVTTIEMVSAPGSDNRVKTLGVLQPVYPHGGWHVRLNFGLKQFFGGEISFRSAFQTKTPPPEVVILYDGCSSSGTRETERRMLEFANAAPTEFIDYSQLTTGALIQSLSSNGYTVNAVSVDKKQPSELVTKRSQLTGQADAYLDTAVLFWGIGVD